MRHAVIMAGGYGERFWPLSRRSRPKQIVPICSDKPMIQETVERISDLFDNHVHIVTTQKLAESMKPFVPQVEFIVEPIPKNTAAAIGLSAAQLAAKDKDAVMFLETADHRYEDVESYRQTIQQALTAAENNDSIILLGINPTSPHTGYGYIEEGEKKEGDIFKVKSFREKPDKETAQKFLDQKTFLWNSGMFVAKCSVMLNEIKTHLPDLGQALDTISKADFKQEIIKQEFEKIQSISIDYGVMEKSENALVLKADMHWDDVGDLKAYERCGIQDENQNVNLTDVTAVDSKNNIIIGSKPVALLGVNNLIVAETEDIIFITSKDRAQDIKQIVKKLTDDEKTKKFVE